MKKFYFGLILAFVAMSQISLLAQPSSPLVVTAAKAVPTIDGEGADAAWTDAPWHDIAVVFKDEAAGFSGPDDFTGKFKVINDEAKIYFFFDITDDIVTIDPGAHWVGDKVEICFGGLNANYDNAAGANGTGARQFAIKAQYDKTVQGENGSNNYAPASNSLETNGVTYEYVETAVGYTLEVAIDRAIALEGAVGTIDFDVDVADNDEVGVAGVRYRKSWFNDGAINELWGSMSGAGKMRLAGSTGIFTPKSVNRADVYVFGNTLIVKTDNNVDVSIFDLNGRNVLAEKNVKELNISSLNKGAYVVKVINAGVVSTSLFIK